MENLLTIIGLTLGIIGVGIIVGLLLQKLEDKYTGRTSSIFKHNIFKRRLK